MRPKNGSSVLHRYDAAQAEEAERRRGKDRRWLVRRSDGAVLAYFQERGPAEAMARVYGARVEEAGQ
jgi:hypothetical protein